MFSTQLNIPAPRNGLLWMRLGSRPPICCPFSRQGHSRFYLEVFFYGMPDAMRADLLTMITSYAMFSTDAIDQSRRISILTLHNLYTLRSCYSRLFYTLRSVGKYGERVGAARNRAFAAVDGNIWTATRSDEENGKTAIRQLQLSLRMTLGYDETSQACVVTVQEWNRS